MIHTDAIKQIGKGKARERGAAPLLLLLVLVLVIGAVGWYVISLRKGTVTIPMVKPQELTLELMSPLDGALAVDGEILVKGKTAPNATVTIFTEDDETIVQADAAGNFEETITLSTGINNLVVTAFGDDGQEKSVSVNIVHDSEP